MSPELWRSSGLPVGVVAIVGTVAIANLGNSIISPAMAAIKDEFGASAGEVGLIASGFGLGRLAMDLPAGYLTDRLSAARLFVLGIVVLGGTAILAALSTSLQQLILARTAMGFGSAIMSTVALTLLARTARPEQRGGVLSLYTSSMLIGHAFSPTIGGYLATIFSWRATFIFCAVTPFLALPLNLLATSKVAQAQQSGSASHARAVDKESRASPGSTQEGAVLIRWPALVAVYFGTFVTFFNRQGMRQAILPLYGGMVLGLNPDTIGIILTVASFATIVVNLPSGVVGDRIGLKRLLLPGMTIIVLGNLVLLSGTGQEVYVIATVLISAGVLANSMLSGLVADLVPERWIGQGMGMYRFTGDLGFVLGPFLLGLLLDGYGFGAASVFGALVVLLGAGAILAMVPHQRVPPQPQVRVDGRGH